MDGIVVGGPFVLHHARKVTTRRLEVGKAGGNSVCVIGSACPIEIRKDLNYPLVGHGT